MEVPHEKHWFDTVLSSLRVLAFLSTHSHHTTSKLPNEYHEKGFVLTVVNPGEMGSKGGWKVLEVDVPGR